MLGVSRNIIARLNADGSLDTSFDGDGIATRNVGTASLESSSVAVQADGKILVGGGFVRAFGGGFSAALRGRYGVSDHAIKHQLALAWQEADGAGWTISAYNDFREIGDEDTATLRGEGAARLNFSAHGCSAGTIDAKSGTPSMSAWFAVNSAINRRSTSSS